MADKKAGSNKAVTVPGFTLAGSDAMNYTLTGSGSGVTVNIAKKPITVAYAGIDKVFDGTAFAGVHVTTSDVVSGDSVGFYADASYCTACGYAYFATTGSTP